MGDRIALRTLASVSGVPHSTIAHNCAADNWRAKRSKIREAVDFQTIDLVAAQIAGKTAEILNSHYEAENEIFDMANAIVGLIAIQLKQMEEQFEKSQDSDDRSSKDIYQLQSLISSLNTAQNTIAGAINGQRKALGLDYEDLNYAVASVRRSGLEVVGRSDFEAFKEYLENQAKSRADDFEGPAVIVSTL